MKYDLSSLLSLLCDCLRGPTLSEESDQSAVFYKHLSPTGGNILALLLMIIIFLLMHNIDKASGFSLHWRVTTILSVIWLEVHCYYTTRVFPACVQSSGLER